MKQLLILSFSALTLTGCVTPLEPVRPQPDPVEDESSMEKYVECVRDKRRDENDPPCFLG